MTVFYSDPMRPSMATIVEIVDYEAHLVRIRTIGGDTFCVPRYALTIGI